ncbi:MAG: hypothetical protein AB1733_11365 [Thermodesulfobacteriota bacterium]
MRILAVRLIFLDAVYYAREGLSAAVTPTVLHGTALNGAFSAATNELVARQSFLTFGQDGGANVPHYVDSRFSPKFYATPARSIGSVRYRAEVAKGDSEGFVEINLRGPTRELKRIDSRVQPLKYRKLYFLAPECEFLGFLIVVDESWRPPELIRLGSFRSPVRAEYVEAVAWKPIATRAIADHPVDPLISDVARGVIVNMLPYGVVENAAATPAVEIKFRKPCKGLGKSTCILAWPTGYAMPGALERIRGRDATVFM